AVLREARGELRQAIADRQLAMNLWKDAPRLEELRAIASMRARLGESARAARELAGVARQAAGKPALQLACWQEAARLFAKAREAGNASWSWVELDRVWRSLGPKARAGLPQ